MKTPINFETEIGEGNDLTQLRVIGRFGLAIALFIAAMLIIPNPASGRLAIAILALIIGGISGLMMWRGKRALNRGKNA